MRFLLVARDVTEQRVSARELRQAHAQLAFAVDASGHGFFDWQIQGGTVTYSDRYAEMLGYEIEDLEPRLSAWERLVHPDDRAASWAAVQAHLKGATPRFEFEQRLRHREGHYIHVMTRGQTVVTDEDGRPLRISGSITDVTTRRLGECLPYWDNFVEIDTSTPDIYGIPALKIHMGWGDNERAMIPDMAVSAAEMMEAAGAKNIQPYAVPDRIPGYGIHELGVARMGANPRTSVLNQFQQAHDVSNLFVMDGASFPSGGCQNPTLTIMALAVRSTDYLMEEMKKGNV